ncbi:hypothetical protein BDA99DRAFT_515186 [Phascolomyces articulosus]|uniref:Uncharacterized protein n=1 Tax=Phascolomyces articulosus TaxID=60185 RepID=A0AAD5PCH8_9FUNG|nr:hypothetical protein BDA99DRAFT_515186 [Phascolomyces articulosus]
MNVSKVKHDYRALLKAGYAAVQYERHHKLQIHQRIRHRFEHPPSPVVNDTQINNTIEFLNTAAKRRGLEHDIVRNICSLDRYRAQYDIRPPLYNRKLTPDIRHLHDTSHDELDELIKLLNNELELCL